MRILDTLTSKIGAPDRLRTLGSPNRPSAVVGRWRHDGACFDLSEIDTIQVIFNVSGGQRVEVETDGCCVQTDIRAGSIAINSPGNPSRVTVTGSADIIHIAIARELIEAAAGANAALVGLESATCGLRLQACAAQALVALARDERDQFDVLSVIVERIAWLLARPAMERLSYARGGLSPAARRRVGALIQQRLESGSGASLSLNELADAAQLSRFHFARAFRETEGNTPHAHILAARIDYAPHAVAARDEARK